MGHNKTILIVEDEALNRKILRKYLNESFDIIEASDGIEAWNILEEQSDTISAILLDINMPEMNGYQVMEKMQEAKMEIPVIVITSSDDEDSEQKALNVGAWDFVTKPFNPKILLTRLKNTISRSQLAGFERLQYLSDHDELTDLYTRKKMFALTATLIQKHPDVDFLFFKIDIDHFSLFNTSFGENEGNMLLKFLAERIRSIASASKYYVCGHINADVFCVCASCEDNFGDSKIKAEQLQNAITAYRKDYRIKISVGACSMDNRSLSIDDYYIRANVAAQLCKGQYSKYFELYDDATGKKLNDAINIAGEMQDALDKEQFVIYLQPKFDLSTDTACGAEALVRWQHPERGLVPPGIFIPVFEGNGFISKLDYYVWEKTCGLLRKWLDSGAKPFPVSVNISRVSLYNPKLAELLTGLTDEYMIKPEMLQLEITESAYMTNPNLMKQTIKSLHEAGFTILMDDFGSGYSSLNSLKEIDMDVLKVDMKFLPVGNEAGKAEIILSSIIKMANWLGMRVVVEGVENRLQRDFLKGAGCEYVQGFFYSKPIPSQEYEEKYVKSIPEKNEHVEEFDVIPKYNMTILVIDDNEMDREILKANLEQLYKIQLCSSAEEALAFLQNNKNRVRLILVDNIMEGMSGLEFLHYCKEDENLKTIPKIVITAQNTIDDQVQAFKEGAYDFIPKPFQKEIVVARVKHVMEVIRNTPIYD